MPYRVYIDSGVSAHRGDVSRNISSVALTHPCKLCRQTTATAGGQGSAILSKSRHRWNRCWLAAGWHLASGRCPRPGSACSPLAPCDRQSSHTPCVTRSATWTGARFSGVMAFPLRRELTLNHEISPTPWTQHRPASSVWLQAQEMQFIWDAIYRPWSLGFLLSRYFMSPPVAAPFLSHTRNLTLFPEFSLKPFDYDNQAHKLQPGLCFFFSLTENKVKLSTIS